MLFKLILYPIGTKLDKYNPFLLLAAISISVISVFLCINKREKVSSTPFRLYFVTNRTFASFAPHALKGQKLLAQGIALGYYGREPVAL